MCEGERVCECVSGGVERESAAVSVSVPAAVGQPFGWQCELGHAKMQLCSHTPERKRATV